VSKTIGKEAVDKLKREKKNVTIEEKD
jgi:hypothetical protein